MKISKLFHWLYAILMLLPFLVFLPNAFYYGFNESAVAQEKTEQVPVYYESNEVNNVSDLQLNHIYQWTDNWNNTQGYSTLNLFNVLPSLISEQFSLSNVSSSTLTLSGNSAKNLYLYVVFNDNTYRFINISEDLFYFVIVGNVNANVPIELIYSISQTDYKYVKEYQTLITSMSITDSMSYAWDSVWQNDLFSWSYGSFLTEPFIYIGNVFNVPLDNSLYYALSYWLDISIIWLCFDVIMYVPLLVHRWLDKGIVE